LLSVGGSNFYEYRYQDGYNHGRYIEGRSLGREKGYGRNSYLTRALCQRRSLKYGTGNDEFFYISNATRRRSISNANRLLELITQFPKINPSSTNAGSGMDDIPQIATQSSPPGVRLTLRAARSDQQADGEKVGEVTRESPKFGRSYLN